MKPETKKYIKEYVFAFYIYHTIGIIPLLALGSVDWLTFFNVMLVFELPSLVFVTLILLTVNDD